MCDWISEVERIKMFDKGEGGYCAPSFGIKTLRLKRADHPNAETGNKQLLVKRGRQLNAFDIIHFWNCIWLKYNANFQAIQYLYVRCVKEAVNLVPIPFMTLTKLSAVVCPGSNST